MPETVEYVSQLDDIVAEPFQYGTNFVLKEKIKGIAKTGASVAWSGAFSAMSIPVLGSLPALVAAASTKRHISKLEALAKNDSAYPCTCDMCAQSIAYVINQKKWKLGRSIAGVVPVVGTLEAARAKIYGAFKKNAGQKRLECAVLLWHVGRDYCKKARMVVLELLGEARGQQALKDPNGYVVIAEKLRST